MQISAPPFLLLPHPRQHSKLILNRSSESGSTLSMIEALSRSPPSVLFILLLHSFEKTWNASLLYVRGAMARWLMHSSSFFFPLNDLDTCSWGANGGESKLALKGPHSSKSSEKPSSWKRGAGIHFKYNSFFSAKRSNSYSYVKLVPFCPWEMPAFKGSRSAEILYHVIKLE